MKKRQKGLALKLRYQKKSYNEISQLLNVSKSTLHYWFKNDNLSQQIKDELRQKNNDMARKKIKLMNKARSKKLEIWRNGFRQEAKKEYSLLKSSPLFIAGINLYWGEGDSLLKNNLVRLANTDYRMIIIFNKFLQEICKVPQEKIKMATFLYPDLDADKCKRFWSRKTGIKLSQFYKPQIIGGKHPAKRLEYGICSILVCSRGLKEKIMVWIDLFGEMC